MVEVFSLLIRDKAILILDTSNIRLSNVALNFVVKGLTSSALFKRIASKSCVTVLGIPNTR